MIQLLIRVLLWLAVGGLLYWLFLKFIPKSLFMWLGGLVLAALIVLSFYEPNQQVPEPIWQVLIFPFKPLNFALLLLSSCLFNILKSSKDQLLKTLISCAYLILLLFSLPVVSQQLVQLYEVAPEADEINTATQTIIVLGQGTTEINLAGGSTIQLTEQGDRLLYAATLYKQQTNKPLMIVSAGERGYFEGEEKNRLETADIETFLQNTFGIPDEKIITEPKSNNLRSSVLNIKKILEERKLLEQKVTLVTSAIQMRRAELAFTKEKIQVVPKPANFYSFRKDNEDLKPKLIPLDFLPSANALRVSSAIVEDFFGSVYYFLRGWIAPQWTL